MGCGKTTLANKLSSPDVKVFDLDKRIVERLGGESIASFVKSNGWTQFREAETKELKSFLEDNQEMDQVLSLGGGAVSAENLKVILEAEALLVWLNIPFETCFERIKDDPERPLVLEKGESGLRELFESRLEQYGAAQCHIGPKDLKKIQNFQDFLQRLGELGLLDADS